LPHLIASLHANKKPFVISGCDEVGEEKVHLLRIEVLNAGKPVVQETFLGEQLADSPKPCCAFDAQ
jgi:hypothetical protein